MEWCRLCQRKEATQTNSHIVPNFLTRRFENPPEETRREYGMTYDLGGTFAKGYVGRSVSPDKVESTYGVYTDDDLRKNKNPNTEDYYFCPCCEKRFSVVERIYSEVVSHFDKTGTAKPIDSSLGILFWCSVFWRLGQQIRQAMNFTDQDMELMRSVLDECLPEPDQQPDMEIIKAHGGLRKMSYGIARCTLHEEKWGLLVHHLYTKPHALIVADYIVLFSLDENYSNLETVDFFGIRDNIKRIPINRVDSHESVTIIEPDIIRILIAGVTDFHAKRFVEDICLCIDNMFYDVMGYPCPDYIKCEIFEELTDIEIKFGRRYTVEEFQNCVSLIHISQTSDIQFGCCRQISWYCFSI